MILLVEVASLDVYRQIISALNLAITPNHFAELSLHPSVTDLSRVVHQYVEHEEPKVLCVEGLSNLFFLSYGGKRLPKIWKGGIQNQFNESLVFTLYVNGLNMKSNFPSLNNLHVMTPQD